MSPTPRDAARAATAPYVLVVDDHDAARESIADALRQAGYRVEGVSSALEALQRLPRAAYDCIITDLQMPGMDGLEFLQRIEPAHRGVAVVMITAHASVPTAVQAMRRGAFDYLEKPFDVDQLEDIVRRAVAHARAADAAARVPDPRCGGLSRPLVGSSPAMRALRQRIACVAQTPETVLIHGESGTGKELVARAIHAQSPRAPEAFVDLNCPVLSAQLLESELFGHERGAFTGADSRRQGRFELAHRGTLLLDEVTEIEPHVQAKLLRVLQERCFQRVGSSETIHVDVRVLATTNRDLARLVAEGRFRHDLYYRLNVLPIEVPPLRARRQDVPELAQYFASRAADRLGRPAIEWTPSAENLLLEYHWPGNVRELENLMTRASVLGAGRRLDADDLRPWLIDPTGRCEASAAIEVGLSLQEMERKLIEATLQHFGGHRQKTAQALGIGLRTLTGKLRTYGYAPRARAA
jgi:DNA-binding NtrC family response regulator